MKITEGKIESVVVLSLNGRLDASTSGDLEKKVSELIDRGEKNLVVDFSQLDYISSAGLRVLLMAAKKTSGLKGKVVLACLREHVREVFDIAGFTAIFPICPDQVEALKLF